MSDAFLGGGGVAQRDDEHGVESVSAALDWEDAGGGDVVRTRRVKLIHSHYPGIVNEEFTRYSNALMEACVGGDPLIPNFLIDHGADVNEGGFPGRGPLYAAVTHRRPLELVKKMVQGGAWISGSTLDAAIHQRQHHALEFLIDRYQYGSQESFLPDARKTNDQIVIEIVEKREKRLKPKDKTYRGNIFKAKG